MTHQQKLDFIREACIKANPSILELTFGCEMVDKKEPLDWAKRVAFISYSKGVIYCREADGSVFKQKRGLEDFEILGRKIGLADVLVAISYFSEGNIAVNTGGRLMEWESCIPDQGKYSYVLAGYKIVGRRVAKGADIRWNLLKDDLRLQSEETVSFIYDILK